MIFFNSRSARSARTAGTKIALRFPRLFVCLFVCLSVCLCVRTYHALGYY